MSSASIWPASADRPRPIAFGYVPHIVLWTLASGTCSESSLAALLAVLDPWERARADRFRCARDRQIYVHAHALRRALLAAEHGRPPAAWRFTDDPLRKPLILDTPAGAQLDVNISHTPGLVAAVTGQDMMVGVDVEATDRRTIDAETAASVCTPGERDELMRLASDPAAWHARFLSFWMRKEAIAKTLGLGLSLPLDAVDVRDPGRIVFLDFTSESRSANAGRPDDWTLWDLQLGPGHCGCVATRTGATRTGATRTETAMLVQRRLTIDDLTRLLTHQMRPIRGDTLYQAD